MNRITLGAALLGTGLFAAPALGQVVLTASSWLPPTHTLSQSQAKWCEEVSQATANRVRCNVLPKPVVAPPGTFDAVRDGLADLSFSVHGYTPGRYTLTQMAELPFLGDSSEATSVAYQRMYDRHLAKAGEHKGMKVIAVFTHGPGLVMNTKRPVTQIGDLAGLRWRVGGGVVNEIGKLLGANMTLRPATESYELISSGVMDGTWFPAESFESFRLDRHIRHVTAFPGGLYNTSFAFVMNEGTWNRISKQDQQAIEKLSGEHAARLFGRGWDTVDRRAKALMQAQGVQWVNADQPFVDEVRKRIGPLEQKWSADAKAKGLANPDQVLKEFRAEISKL
jgi:TRAP-type transport system periplasmic protein